MKAKPHFLFVVERGLFVVERDDDGPGMVGVLAVGAGAVTAALGGALVVARAALVLGHHVGSQIDVRHLALQAEEGGTRGTRLSSAGGCDCCVCVFITSAATCTSRVKDLRWWFPPNTSHASHWHAPVTPAPQS